MFSKALRCLVVIYMMAMPSSLDKNQGPADRAQLLPQKQSGLRFQKCQLCVYFKAGLLAEVT